MTAIFPIVAFLVTLAAGYRSLGWGLLAAIGVGYFNGVIRANFLGVYTTFMFDAGVLGLYAAFVLTKSEQLSQLWSRPVGWWLLGLIGWPFLLAFIPVNDLLVQLVALRGTVWLLPILLVATQLKRNDLQTLARGLAGLNLVAFAGGMYVYIYGVESLYPDNPITQIIYLSRDVGGIGGSEAYHRVPSFFLSAHAYGGTMLMSLPLLLDRAFGTGMTQLDRLWAVAGALAAVAGILMCAARQPLLMFLISSVAAWVISGFNLRLGLVIGGVVIAGLTLGATSERFQRGLQAVERVSDISDRIDISVNKGFVDYFLEYPAGAGMGSSAGTSVPFFLADRAPEQLGLENDYCRILIDQGWIGLFCWIGFILWYALRLPPSNPGEPWGLAISMSYAFSLTAWVTAIIGTGLLASIPGSVLLLTLMGIVVAARDQKVFS